MLRSIEVYLARTQLAISVTVVAALVTMLLLNATAVLTRVLGLGSLHWAHEISLLLALGVYFLAYGVIIRRHGEIRVEFFARRLPQGAQRHLALVGDLLQLALYAYIGILGIRYADRISVLPMPMTRASQALTIVPLIIGFLDSATVIVMRFLVKRQAVSGVGLSRETV